VVGHHLVAEILDRVARAFFRREVAKLDFGHAAIRRFFDEHFFHGGGVAAGFIRCERLLPGGAKRDRCPYRDCDCCEFHIVRKIEIETARGCPKAAMKSGCR
jgi:hypothetical protein